MKKTVKLLKKHRRYSEAFKKELVREYESGRYSVRQLGRLHGIAFQNIYSWIYRYSHYNEKGVRIVEYKDSTESKTKELERRLSDLEGALGRKQIELEYLEKLLEVAGSELGLDIKKTFGTKRCPGSVPRDRS